ncbi:MAG: ABC transporter ATP-binding protein [Sphingobacterium sp.]
MNDPIIELRGLRKCYGSLIAVDHLDLKIQQGEIFGLLGPNGAGKTTTILMMLGLSEPTAGEAMVCGFNATRQPIEVKRKVGYLQDNVGFYDDLTALQNLSLIARLNGIEETTVEKRSLSLLQTVGLGDVSQRKVATFSRGMKQRLGLADVLIKEPSVIILDEPTLGIDPSGVNEFLQLIKTLSTDQNLTVLLSSHHLQQVQRVCDRVGIFVKGKLLVEGSISGLAKNLLDRDGHSTWVELEEELSDPTQLEEALAELPGFIELTIKGLNLEIKTTDRQTSKIIQTMVQNGAKIIGVGQKSYGLDELYEKYFENQVDNNVTHEKSNSFFKGAF